MRILTKTLLIGGAALALAGTAVAESRSAAAANAAPRATLILPDGTTRSVRLIAVPSHDMSAIGPVALRVAPVALPVASVALSPFAMIDRIAADMDAQMAAMLRQAAALRAAAPVAPDAGMTMVSSGALPAGTVSYSFVSTSNGSTTCAQSVQMTAMGSGQAPQVVSRQSGDCAAMNRPLIQATTPAASPPEPAMIKAKADAPVAPPRATVRT